MPTVLKIEVEDGIVGGPSSQLLGRQWTVILRGCHFENIRRDGQAVAMASLRADNVFLNPEETQQSEPEPTALDDAARDIVQAYLTAYTPKAEKIAAEIAVLGAKLKHMMGSLTGAPEPKKEEVIPYLQALVIGQKKAAAQHLQAIFLRMANRKLTAHLTAAALQDIPDKDDDD